MSRIIIYTSDRFQVTSYVNGWAFHVKDKIDHKSLLVQDDDAKQFRAELEAFEHAFPDAPYDEFYSDQLVAYKARRRSNDG